MPYRLADYLSPVSGREGRERERGGGEGRGIENGVVY